MRIRSEPCIRDQSHASVREQARGLSSTGQQKDHNACKFSLVVISLFYQYRRYGELRSSPMMIDSCILTVKLLCYGVQGYVRQYV